MLLKRVIPCLDIKEGKVVKGVRFQGLRDVGDPVELAKRYEAEGADELTFLDISAGIEQRKAHLELVSRIRNAIAIPITVGGGVRSVADAQGYLEAGADKVGANSAAVRDPQLVREIAARFGNQCMIIAVDAGRFVDPHRQGFEVIIDAGKTRTGLDALEWISTAVTLGAGEVLLTSWDQDGTRSGYDLPLLKAACNAVSVPIIASGGAAHSRHCVEAFDVGAEAVLAASIFHDGEYSVTRLKKELAAAGVRCRL